MLSVDISLVVVFLMVWILVVVLTRLFFKPLRKVMENRDRTIDEDRAAGESASSEQETLLRKIEDDIKQTRTAALAARQTLERRAAEQKERLLGEVSRECREEVSRARAQLEKQVETLKTELESESERMAERIENKLLS
jgi:F-type H+-transporting ATPase subunit b